MPSSYSRALRPVCFYYLASIMYGDNTLPLAIFRDDMKYQARELVDSQRTRPQSNAAAYLIYLYRQGKQGKQNKIMEASI